jgi:hypothetical protein
MLGWSWNANPVFGHSTITTEQVKDLRREARAAGDERMVRTCNEALLDVQRFGVFGVRDAETPAWRRCREAIEDAEASEDE